MVKRIFLFLATNLLVITTISIVFSVLGIQPYLSQNGINYQSLLIFCLIWGMGGSFISLLLSKYMAKVAMGVRVIDPQTATGAERQLLSMVYTLAQRVGLSQPPEVGIYDSPEVNAFATGATKNSSLVAVSTGLLANMAQGEVEGVIGHELSHVANGDMVTMTLIQGVVNAFALFLSRIIAYAISTALSRSNEENGMSMGIYYILSIVFDIVFTILGTIVVAAFSRWREFRADKGGAQVAGKANMIAALKRLQDMSEASEDKRGEALATLKISHKSKWLGIFATHPPLSERIERLQKE
jgi:heat shock protein HtpX